MIHIFYYLFIFLFCFLKAQMSLLVNFVLVQYWYLRSNKKREILKRIWNFDEVIEMFIFFFNSFIFLLF